jgi:hypothetical protein
MYDAEIADCYRRIRVAQSLNVLVSNPDFKAIIVDGFLRDEVLKRSLNINADKSGTVAFLESVQTFRQYLDRVVSDGEQATIDLNEYQQLIQDGR